MLDINNYNCLIDYIKYKCIRHFNQKAEIQIKRLRWGKRKKQQE